MEFFRLAVADSLRLKKALYPEREIPKTLSIPETETRCFVTFDASTFAATSVYMASVNLFPECLWFFLTHQVRPACHGVNV